MKLGCCYFPEHWPRELWEDDARRMKGMGLSRVRIGEFAWSRIEPEPGRFDWKWLDAAIEILAGEGLEIILCTPTATPPKWLVDAMPDMLPVDRHGRPRKFGSRRHYCYSHGGYREECRRIVTALADRYGEHPAIVGWQIDNEHGCHDTVRSYSDAAAAGFRRWLAEKYGTVEALNAAWGNVFWSMEYGSFDAVDLPILTVTEPNPAHVLDYRRFASDEVVSFNKLQADILREKSSGRDVTHNFMGFLTDFDHHKLSSDLDVATWDSYPLGFLEQAPFADDLKRAFLRQGHPDFAAFHHDLYRGCAKGRWGIMEQQPGPVNWARFNPSPLPGMVRLWTLEALAHGAELVSYFRWRQAPFAQEQMHAGLLRPDSSEDWAGSEARQAAQDLLSLGSMGEPSKSVALVFSYEAQWLFEAQPQGRSFSYLMLAFEMYAALRSLGLDIDIVSPDADLDGYAMVVAPSLPILRDEVIERLGALDCPTLFGPRTGSKTEHLSIPESLAPGRLRDLIKITVQRVESLRDGVVMQGEGFSLHRWFEHIESELAPTHVLSDGRGAVYAADNYRYLAGWPDDALLRLVLGAMTQDAGLSIFELPEGLRTRTIGDLRFVFNYAAEEIDLASIFGVGIQSDYLLGGPKLESAGVAAWRL